MIRVVDSGLENLKASIDYCDDCDSNTVHLSVPEGVAVCHQCGYNSAWEHLADETDDEG
jgi:hypothetical protein